MPADRSSDGVVCPACGGTLAPWRLVPASEPLLGEARFALWHCSSCGSAVTVGAAAHELHELGAYGHGDPRLQRVFNPVLERFDRRRLRMLARLVRPPARLLDAGAGRGRFVAAARAAGYDATGVEPSIRGSEAARAIGAPLIRATIEAAELPQRSFDAVTVWHVLEHLDDAAGALARIRGWLRPGGALLVGVPNLASLQARLSGGHWYHLDVPRHRVHFTEQGVHALLRRQGFTVVATEHRLLEHNPFGMWQSWVNLLTRHPSYLYNLLKRNAPLRSIDLPVTLTALPLAPLAALLELLAAVSGRGGTIAVLAQRAR